MASESEASSSVESEASSSVETEASSSVETEASSSVETEARPVSIAVTARDLVHAGEPAELGKVLFSGELVGEHSLAGVLGAVENHLVQVRNVDGVDGDVILCGGRRSVSTTFGKFSAGAYVGAGKLADGFSLAAVARYVRDGKAGELVAGE